MLPIDVSLALGVAAGVMLTITFGRGGFVIRTIGAVLAAVCIALAIFLIK